MELHGGGIAEDLCDEAIDFPQNLPEIAEVFENLVVGLLRRWLYDSLTVSGRNK